MLRDDVAEALGVGAELVGALLTMIFATNDALLATELDVDDICPDVGTRRCRNVYVRADYEESVWWKMLANGQCKIPGTRESKLFRRRFTVSFARYKEIVDESRTWPIVEGSAKTFGDMNEDAVHRKGVPLELKVLGALRMCGKVYLSYECTSILVT